MSEFSKIVKKEKSDRILTFDLLRGYFLCVILLNHLYFYPSGFEFFTGKSALYASTAEGFFVVSGIVLGIVRGRKLLNQPFKVAAKLLWKRSIQLYLASIILTFLFTFVAQLFLDNPGLKYGVFTDWTNWQDLLWKTITLNYVYGWADFLRLYAIFIFVAPFALWLLRKGWLPVYLIISAAIWALYPLINDFGDSNKVFSWQFIFFAGFAIGFYWPKIVTFWRELTVRTRKTIGWSTVAVFAITLLASASLVFGNEIGGTLGPQIDAVHHVVEQNFDKDRLPIPRLILGAVWFWALFYIVRRYESWIMKRFGWFLLGFGMNSLYVYTLSAFVVFFAHLVIAPPGFGHWILNLLFSIIAFGLLQLAIQTKFLMKIIPR